MGGGISSDKIQNQESYVRSNLEKAKERMSHFRNCDGSNRYTDNQIRMKLRQEYNSNGNINNRIDCDSYIRSSHWNSYKN